MKTTARPKKASKKETHKTTGAKSAKPTVHKSVKAQADGHWIKHQDFSRLVERLREAQETLDAIRSGSVDAVVVNGSEGAQIYSLAGAEQPYRVYLERMQEGAVTVSAEGLILYCNERFAEMVGAPLERVISADLRQHVDPEAWAELKGVFSRSDKVIKHETLLHSASGNDVPVNFTASQLPLEGQNVMCLVVTDQTAQKAQEELRMAKELAEKANLAKDGFLARLSHELRTPLTPALLALGDMEEDSSLSPKMRQQLAMVRRNIELEARLIDDLLDLTRIVSGKLEFHSTPVDVNVVLQRAVEICRSEIEEKRITVHLHLEAAESSVRGDGVRIQQVFWNLIRNAAKFTPAGGSITVRSGNRPKSREIWVKVEDTGIGFAPEQASNLFAAFEQGGREITQRFGGLGLGLAISQSIIAGHEGRIRAESRGPGHGAIFTVELPLLKSDSNGSRQPKASKEEAPKSNSIRILLVEDHADTRENMQILLRRKHKVEAADCATQAIRLASKQSFDLVVSDLGLPDMSGLEMMRTLRAQFGLRGIAISGFGMDEDVALAKEAGFVQHLTKPVRLERLLKAIEETSERL